jgi:hypothetical protein
MRKLEGIITTEKDTRSDLYGAQKKLKTRCQAENY